MRRINEIIVHCTATPAGREVTVADVRRWHKARGFADIGYHYLIYLDGSVHEGRPLEQIGAHCVGHNQHSIGVCYVGGLKSPSGAQPSGSFVPGDTRTPEQKRSLLALLSELKQRFPEATIHGHREFANKACPCFDARGEYKDL